MRSTIVNEAFARSYFGGRNPIGRRIGLGSGPDIEANIEIVGVVRDFTYGNLREQNPQAFLPGVLEGFGAVGLTGATLYAAEVALVAPETQLPAYYVC